MMAFPTETTSSSISLQQNSFRLALRLAMVFAVVKLAIHIATNIYTPHIGYRMLPDEYYYILCGRLLAWGYVDHGPMVALQARMAESIFGLWVPGFRIFSAMAGAVRVGLTGLMTWTLGGRQAAQALAMMAVLAAPQYLRLDGILSMTSFESMFWMGCLLTVMLMVQGASARCWLIFGTLAGLGLLNKPSMGFFLMGLCAGLLITKERRILWSRWTLVGIAVILLLVTPYILWQAQHSWVTLEFLHNAALGRQRNGSLREVLSIGSMYFVLSQIRTLNPLSALIWVAGLIWLLMGKGARQWRWIGWMYLIFASIMFAMNAKDYYVDPVYPVLFAAGGVAWQCIFALTQDWQRIGRVAFPLMNGLLIITGLVLLPMSIPVLRPAPLSRYYITISKLKVYEGPIMLPGYYGDRMYQQQFVDEVARIYNSLPAQDRGKIGIFTPNYELSSVLNVLGAKDGLPIAISGHNNYWIWGPHGYTGEVMIVVSEETPEELRDVWSSVQIVGRTRHPYAAPNVGFDYIYLVRGRVRPYAADWNNIKAFG
jgi:hypothetical protein